MLDFLKLVGVLALIVVLLRLRWNLGLVLLLASVVTGLLFGHAPLDLALDILGAAIDPLTLRLVAIVLLIMFLGGILRNTLQLEGLIRSLSDLITDRRWLLALFPMLIGLLPMVGGAMFSAPMVEEASQGLDLTRERQTFVNYWFRHTMEPIVPLYPSLVLAAGLMGVSVQTLAVTQLPLFLAAVAGGILLGLVGIQRASIPGNDQPDRGHTLVLLLKSIWPILLVLALAILLGVDLILALLVTIVILVVVQRLGPRSLLEVVKGIPLSTVPVIFGAMIFRQVLETSSAVKVASEAFATLGIPVPVVIFVVPMIAGLLTGLAVGAFAIGFPIVLPLVGPDLVTSGYGLLAYTGGFVGLMLSPLHLCLALTREYFLAAWGGIYRLLLPVSLLMTATAVIVILLK
jgi:integral membrane protein (TIGR00529 family)